MDALRSRRRCSIAGLMLLWAAVAMVPQLRPREMAQFGPAGAAADGAADAGLAHTHGHRGAGDAAPEQQPPATSTAAVPQPTVGAGGASGPVYLPALAKGVSLLTGEPLAVEHDLVPSLNAGALALDGDWAWVAGYDWEGWLHWVPVDVDVFEMRSEEIRHIYTGAVRIGRQADAGRWAQVR